ncbi:hypothetical protein UFOVP637_32 [uncultured Caudovirales phage]|jgi:hypothetical protein|uniref:Uncharacterized protein n=1 Tax=uncultured Caudovirales phage TaxID=2100421 RepID=A0A6J5N4Z1_9CAUD|nr:hypothetical protein UFOVP637_32 [uncultured Caudovirales phage]
MSAMKSLYLDLTTGVEEVNQTLQDGFDLQNGTFETIDLALCQSIIKLVEMRNTLKELGAIK